VAPPRRPCADESALPESRRTPGVRLDDPRRRSRGASIASNTSSTKLVAKACDFYGGCRWPPWLVEQSMPKEPSGCMVAVAQVALAEWSCRRATPESERKGPLGPPFHAQPPRRFQGRISTRKIEQVPHSGLFKGDRLLGSERRGRSAGPWGQWASDELVSRLGRGA